LVIELWLCTVCFGYSCASENCCEILPVLGSHYPQYLVYCLCSDLVSFGLFDLVSFVLFDLVSLKFRSNLFRFWVLE
jgi:hypothetical protein